MKRVYEGRGFRIEFQTTDGGLHSQLSEVETWDLDSGIGPTVLDHIQHFLASCHRSVHVNLEASGIKLPKEPDRS